jgi:hypothetical protein
VKDNRENCWNALRAWKATTYWETNSVKALELLGLGNQQPSFVAYRHEEGSTTISEMRVGPKRARSTRRPLGRRYSLVFQETERDSAESAESQHERADKTKPVFVYATANNVAALPPELLRKGRFDEMFYVSLPNTSERKEIFEIHLKKRGRWHLAESGKIRMNELIDPKVTGGFSGAEIEAVIKEAMFDSFAAGKDLNMFDLMEAISNVVPLEKMMKTQIAMLSEWCAGRTRPANSPELVDMSPANRAISV